MILQLSPSNSTNEYSSNKLYISSYFWLKAIQSTLNKEESRKSIFFIFFYKLLYISIKLITTKFS